MDYSDFIAVLALVVSAGSFWWAIGSRQNQEKLLLLQDMSSLSVEVHSIKFKVYNYIELLKRLISFKMSELRSSGEMLSDAQSRLIVQVQETVSSLENELLELDTQLDDLAEIRKSISSQKVNLKLCNQLRGDVDAIRSKQVIHAEHLDATMREKYLIEDVKNILNLEDWN